MKSRAMAIALVLCLASSGCADCGSGSSPDADSGDVVDTRESDTFDADDTRSDDGGDVAPDCTETCEEAYTCVDAKVYYQPGGTADCAEGCGQGTVRARCDEGCLQDADVEPILGGSNAHQMCAEHEFRRVYDPCTEDSHCQPVSGQSLVCDEQIRNCVDADEPEYLTSCGLDPAEVDHGEGYVDATTADVPGCEDLPYCLVDREQFAMCTGCTRECTSDDDCPATAECRSVDALSGGDGALLLCVHPERFAPACEVTE